MVRYMTPGTERRSVAWIGHAGLAGSRPGAGPSRETLTAAAGLGLDRLELDVCATDGDELVLRHNSRLPGGLPVHAMTLAELRRLEPDLLTLTDAAEHLCGRVPLLIDVKTLRVVEPLAGWLRRHRDLSEVTVCSENREALLHLRDVIPEVPRWRTLTALWRWTTESNPSQLSPMPRDLFPGPMWEAVDAVADAGQELAKALTALLGTEQVGHRLRRIFAIADRVDLPAYAGQLAGEVGAEAISVDHWAVTPALCDSAHRIGLSVAAWTVNRIDVACALARLGVDAITSDDVATIRGAVEELTADGAAHDVAPDVAISVRPDQFVPSRDGWEARPLQVERRGG